jgi:hypothetical protein
MLDLALQHAPPANHIINHNDYRRTAMTQKTAPGVTVVDIKMPFLSMVVFMVKWAIASIPALIILFLLVNLVIALFGHFSGMGYYRWHGTM